MNKIITSNIRPPIPPKSHDWIAYRDGNDETGPFGYGETEWESVRDLMVNEEGVDEKVQSPAVASFEEWSVKVLSVEERNRPAFHQCWRAAMSAASAPLMAKIGELEGALRLYAGRLRADGNGWEFDVEPGFKGGVARAALGIPEIPDEESLSKPEAPKAEPPLKWQKEREAFAQGKRIQSQVMAEFREGKLQPWFDCTKEHPPQWYDHCVYRIHPDDDQPEAKSEPPAEWKPKLGDEVLWDGVQDRCQDCGGLKSELGVPGICAAWHDAEDRCPECGSALKEAAHYSDTTPEGSRVIVECQNEWHTSTPQQGSSWPSEEKIEAAKKALEEWFGDPTSQPPAVEWPTLAECHTIIRETSTPHCIAALRDALISHATTLLAEQAKLTQSWQYNASSEVAAHLVTKKALIETEKELHAERTAHAETKRQLEEAEKDRDHNRICAQRLTIERDSEKARADKAEYNLRLKQIELDMSGDALMSARQVLGEEDTPFLCDGVARLKEERDRLRAELAQAKQGSSGWIAVSERMPEDRVRVLVSGSYMHLCDSSVYPAQFDPYPEDCQRHEEWKAGNRPERGTWHFHTYNSIHECCPTHWMPIPPLPQPEDAFEKWAKQNGYNLRKDQQGAYLNHANRCAQEAWLAEKGGKE